MARIFRFFLIPLVCAWWKVPKSSPNSCTPMSSTSATKGRTGG